MLQLKIIVCIALQVLLGWIPCVLQFWTQPGYPSIKPLPGRKTVDQWQWRWMNWWVANSEDGVSGQQALVWDDKGNLVPYASLFPAGTPKWWIAYCWNLRNNANNLKRPLRDDGLNTPWNG